MRSNECHEPTRLNPELKEKIIQFHIANGDCMICLTDRGRMFRAALNGTWIHDISVELPNG